ncbi:MAG: HDOD domain-containing protein [Oceanidesulfovibrio sp.]
MSNQQQGQAFLAELSDVKQDLPYSLSLLRDLFGMTGESSRASMDEIAQTIAHDQGLTTKILALANSAFYGLQAKVSSVSRPITLLGLKAIRNLVLILGAQAVTVRHSLPDSFLLGPYWKHQLSVGVIAKTIAEKRNALDPDILFTAGLLHDFGKILIALHRPDDWQTIKAIVANRGMQHNLAEELHWGLEHGLVGAMTLNSWNLPQELTEPLNWHHSPALAGDFRDDASIICLADAMHHKIEDPNAPLVHPAGEVLANWEWDADELAAECSEALDDDSIDQLAAALI